ncbi:MAG: hypothetical protein AAGC95_12980 [Pseudomonadota bacterium]
MTSVSEESTKAPADKALQEVSALQGKAHHRLYEANIRLEKHPSTSVKYVNGRSLLDLAAAHLAVAKWKLGRATDACIGLASSANPDQDIQDAGRAFKAALEAIARADALFDGVAGETSAPGAVDIDYDDKGTEITFADDVPLVPTICPVVVLRGGAYDMGRQYADQIIDIYGPWVFEEIARKSFSAETRDVIARWAEELRRWTPQIIDFAVGWAGGAAARGVPLTEEQVLSLWTSEYAPAEHITPMGFRGQEQNEKAQAYLAINPIEEMPCSGACAWGRATADGRLIAASTTDHDCTHQATIVAYPDEGNAFIYTPFSVTGIIPVIGQYYMAGHPGMNNKGVAYVHHGGGAHVAEPEELWGYGVRRGASTLHVLQFADTAESARDIELSMPIGETNGILGSAGGFYADAQYAYVLESRHNSKDNGAPIIREHTVFNGDECDILYANNNSLHPDTRNGYVNGAPGSFSSRQEDYLTYDSTAGWHVNAPIEKLPVKSALQLLLTMSTKSSQGRNRYLYKALSTAIGDIDEDFMFSVYRTGANVDTDMSNNDIAKVYLSGKPWDVSAAQRANAFTAVMAPDNGPNGKYWACIGPAKRGLPAIGPAHGFFYYDETAAFWELTLAETPEDMARLAVEKAEKLYTDASAAFEALPQEDDVRTFYGAFLDKAAKSLSAAKALIEDAEFGTHLSKLSLCVREATRAQVRATQVTDAVHPPQGLKLH